MKKTQGFNPYLPSWEYVPDGEPHVFGDRVYVYGSHDRFNGYAFCLKDYVCWSASVKDLTSWRYEGVIYGRKDDPTNLDGEMCLYAPDVTRGPDGKYYLYYCLNEISAVSVAVCDTPAGRFQFLGYVHYPDGTVLGNGEDDIWEFDPGVLTEGDRTYLYTGFCPDAMPNVKNRGATVTVLGPDMLTVIEAPRVILPAKDYVEGSAFDGTGYVGHEFLEASSIRRVGDTYYFIYSTIYNHHLCYATSSSPVDSFTYRGVIISNVDEGIGTYKTPERHMAFQDNNHGSIELINERYYIFYHRHTNSHCFSRQGCIEPITIEADGSIPQVEMTSCGPNNGPLMGEGTYPAYIACNIFCNVDKPEIGFPFPGKKRDARFPFITQDGGDGEKCQGYVANLENGACIGFKYFDCKDTILEEIEVRGMAFGGSIQVLLGPDAEPIGSIIPQVSNEWKRYPCHIEIPDGIQALYFRVVGAANISINGFTLSRSK